MAVSGVLTYEIHGKREGFDLTPGQNLTFNRGISQYLPLEKGQSLLIKNRPGELRQLATQGRHGRSWKDSKRA